jgi:hypothetical protein
LACGASYRAEMPPVQGDDQPSAKPFGKDNDRCIDSTQWKIGVLLNQGTDAFPVSRLGRSDIEVRERRHESGFDCGTKARAD